MSWVELYVSVKNSLVYVTYYNGLGVKSNNEKRKENKVKNLTVSNVRHGLNSIMLIIFTQLKVILYLNWLFNVFIILFVPGFCFSELKNKCKYMTKKKWCEKKITMLGLFLVYAFLRLDKAIELMWWIKPIDCKSYF